MTEIYLGPVVMGIPLRDIFTILAIFAGPVVAVQLTRYLDRKKESKERKLQIFKTLMATRAYTVSWGHVEALNQIDLEFNRNDIQEKAVLDAWKSYLDLLGDKSISPEQWSEKRVDLLVELLHKMAVVLGYDFDKVHIKNSSYSPSVHGDIEEEQRKIRQGVIEILEGRCSLPVHDVDHTSETHSSLLGNY